MSKVPFVDGKQFANEVEGSSGTVLVDFTASWCPPCKALAPVLESVAARYEGRAKVVKVDADENADIAARYGVTGLPNLLFFRDGEIVNQAVGYQSEEKLVALLDDVLQL